MTLERLIISVLKNNKKQEPYPLGMAQTEQRKDKPQIIENK